MTQSSFIEIIAEMIEQMVAFAHEETVLAAIVGLVIFFLTAPFGKLILMALRLFGTILLLTVGLVVVGVI